MQAKDKNLLESKADEREKEGGSAETGERENRGAGEMLRLSTDSSLCN